MSKRVIYFALGTMLFALCASAAAQQPKKVPRIGYLAPNDRTSDSARSEPIRLALRELGYIEGQNIAIEYRYAAGKFDRFPELAAELVRPKVARVAVLCEPAAPGTVLDVREVLPVAARALRLTIQPWEVRDTDGLEKVFAALNKQRPDGFFVSMSRLMSDNQKRIIGFALKSRLPSMYSRRDFVNAGGLMSYGADEAESYRRVVYFVDKILKGAKPRGSACGAAHEV